MKRRFFSLAVLLLSIILNGCAIGNKNTELKDLSQNEVEDVATTRGTNKFRKFENQRVFDYADKLTGEEEAELEKIIDGAEERTQCDIVIVILNEELKDFATSKQDQYSYAITPNYYTRVYAEDFWSKNKFGYDNPQGIGRGDGVVLVDNLFKEPETGKIYTWLCTTGLAMDNISNEECDYILDQFYLNVEEDYLQSCKNYVDSFEKVFNDEEVITSEGNVTVESDNSQKSASKSYSDDRVANEEKLLKALESDALETRVYDLVSFDGRYTYTFNYVGSTAVYDYYHSLNRYYNSFDYNNYINDAICMSAVGAVVDELDKLWTQMGYSDSDKVREAVNFVQNITYTYDKDSTGKDEWPKYAIETLYEQNGDCEDSSILLAGMLRKMGYGCCLLSFNGHIAVGIDGEENMPGYYYEYDGKRYYYIETTNIGWNIGMVPDEYIESDAYVIVVN